MNCPNCRQPVQSKSRMCEYCGIDLALAVGVVEQQMLSPVELPGGIPMVPEVLVPRVGDYMIERGLLSPADLEKALEYQRQRNGEGRQILLGRALLEMGLTSQEILDQVITSQIMELQTALSEANRNLKRRVDERTRELQAALERLSELSILKSNFIANISHELRTPLTHLKGYLDLLDDGGMGPLTESQMDAISIMKRSETRLERLIDDLIQFSLTTRGELGLKLSTFDLRRLAQLITARSTSKAMEKGIRIELVMPDVATLVRADEDKLGWVLSQLLDNALKFTHKGGQIRLQIHLDGGMANVTVSDTGIGIPTDRIQEIFEPFHQLDNSATRRYPGTGLGLALVRRIIDTHGSQMSVRSTPGQGSQFMFSLPAVEEPRSTVRKMQAAHE